MIRALPFIVLILHSFSASAEAVAAYGARPGYLSSVTKEREQREVEIIILPPPPSDSSTLLARPLVDQRLTREFQTQYELKFGRTDVERNYNLLNRVTVFEYPGGRAESVEAHARRQRQFGEFMIRRLTEHHVDQYAKNNPDVRPLYEMKDRLANVDLKVKQGYKIKFKYSYSGNTLDARLETPYSLGTKVTFVMGGGRVERTIYSITYPYSKFVTLSAFHEIDNHASTSFVCSHVLTKTLSATLTASQAVPVERDRWETSPRQDLILIGLSWTE